MLTTFTATLRTRIFFSAALLACCCAAAPVSAADDVAAVANALDKTTGNPPRALVAQTITADEKLVLVNYRTIYIGFEGESYNDRSLSEVSLKDVVITTAAGEKLTVDEVRQRLGDKETPILATSWRQELPPFFRTLIQDDALLFIFPKDAPTWQEIQDPSRGVR